MPPFSISGDKHVNHVEKLTHELAQRVLKLEGEVAALKAANAAPAADPTPAEESAAADETPAA